MIAQGFNFMFIGMTVVFGFLITLVLVMKVITAFFKKFEHLFPEEVVTSKAPVSASVDVDIAIAIAAVKNFAS